MAEEPNVFLSLGSNRGNRLENLKMALSRLDAHRQVSVRSVSPVYRTEPLYNRRQDDFFNCAVRLATDMSPEELLQVCTTIEREMGRVRTGKRNSPRPIDLDIVFFGDQTVSTSGLTIPHPAYSERKFVLVPLLEIAGDFVCPDTGKTVRETLESSGDESRVEVVREAETV